MRLWVASLVFFGISVSAFAESIAVKDPEYWFEVGHTRFEHCDFPGAARAFSKALQVRSEDAGLHYWAGKSYARMAEVASPLHAARDARRARISLQRAVELKPGNREYVRELFDLYLNSPEWFSGGLGQATLLIDQIEPDDPGGAALLRQLVADARQEYRGPTWRIRQATLLLPGQIGRVIP
jgi:hypothetical protein